MRTKCLLLLALGVPFPLRCQSAYNVTDLGTLGGSYSQAYGINNNGQVVGTSATGQFGGGGAVCNIGQCSLNYAFLWTSGTITSLGLPKGANAVDSVGYGINNNSQVVGNYNYPGYYSASFLYSGGRMAGLSENFGSAYGINSTGQIVGDFSTAGAFGPFHAFSHTGGVTTDLGTLGGPNSTALGINDGGQIVGWASLPGNLVIHAFLYRAGVMRDLGTLGGASSQASGINNSGQVVGWANTASGPQHAFLYNAAVLADLGTLGGAASQADAINKNADIVGWANTADGTQHAVLWRGGTVIDLNSLVSLSQGVSLLESTGINDLGQIVANGSDGRAYLLTPFSGPTPTTLFADDTGTGGFAITTVSGVVIDPKGLQANVRIQNFVRMWLAVNIFNQAGSSPLPQPNLNAGPEGLAATFGLIAPCRSGLSLQPPFVSCVTPGAAQWTAALPSPGTIEFDLVTNTLSASVSLTDLLLQAIVGVPQPVGTVVGVTNQLYANVPSFKAAADCAANGLSAQNSACIESAFLTLARDSQQRNKIIAILGTAAITIGASSLVGKLLETPVSAIQVLGDLVALGIQTRTLGHPYVEVIKLTAK